MELIFIVIALIVIAFKVYSIFAHDKSPSAWAKNIYDAYWRGVAQNNPTNTVVWQIDLLVGLLYSITFIYIMILGLLMTNILASIIMLFILSIYYGSVFNTVSYLYKYEKLPSSKRLEWISHFYMFYLFAFILYNILYVMCVVSV